MENAVEALKFACAVMMFAFALTLSISSFSSANAAVTSIVNMRDRETNYTYIKPTKDSTRTVGIETVVTSMYRAYRENIEIYFFESDGETPLALYYKTNNEGERVKENGKDVEVNYIDLLLENYGIKEEPINHLEILLRSNSPTYDGEYKNQIMHTEGLYEYLSKYTFKESFGEYYQTENDNNKPKKRVITYTVQP